jgi:hypothetical protein
MSENQNENLQREHADAPKAPEQNISHGQRPEPAANTDPLPHITTPENQNMEVHKHPHHVTHKKKWTEYLLEFFMLFLAVFLGFVAENFREHKVELEKTEKHMHTMIENLKYDTLRYSVNAKANADICRGLDSFRHQIDEALVTHIEANKLYYFYWKYGRVHNVPITTDAAISQLKSSGMIRMINNDSLVAEMGDYYGRRINTLENVKITVNKKKDVMNEAFSLFFSYHGFENIFDQNKIWSQNNLNINRLQDILQQDPPLKLLSTSNENFERLFNGIADFEWALINLNAVIRSNKMAADSLIMHIKKEYAFE